MTPEKINEISIDTFLSEGAEFLLNYPQTPSFPTNKMEKEHHHYLYCLGVMVGGATNLQHVGRLAALITSPGP